MNLTQTIQEAYNRMISENDEWFNRTMQSILTQLSDEKIQEIVENECKNVSKWRESTHCIYLTLDMGELWKEGEKGLWLKRNNIILDFAIPVERIRRDERNSRTNRYRSDEFGEFFKEEENLQGFKRHLSELFPGTSIFYTCYWCESSGNLEIKFSVSVPLSSCA